MWLLHLDHSHAGCPFPAFFLTKNLRLLHKTLSVTTRHIQQPSFTLKKKPGVNKEENLKPHSTPQKVL